jgi:hypothetical protein
VLLCATDAGGAANLAALAPALSRRGADVRVITRDGLRHLFDAFAADRVVDAPDDPARFVRGWRPDAIISGTTCFDSPDRRLIAVGAREGIRTAVVLDERYDYRMRFLVDGEPVWPDVITVLDGASIDEAAAEGVPRERCRVTGSPALARIAQAAAVDADAPARRPPSLASRPAWPILLFVSETLADDYGSAPGESGPLGPFAGFTEETVRDWTRSLDGSSFLLVEKLHPASGRVEQPPQLLHGGRVMHIVLKREPLWPLMRAAHAVLGMRSVALLEAALIGVPALSFQPGGIGPERCTAVRLGAVRRTSDPSAAAAWCREYLTGAPRRSAPAEFPFAAPGADERVVAAALDER